MSKNILFVVEGERTEPRFLKRLIAVTRTHSDYKIFSYKTNIYKLLDGMFVGNEIDKDLDFLGYLRSCKGEEEVVLVSEFSDIFLIFDMDPQDPKYDPDRLRKAAEYFCDSTDNGKLYINYPMMESFRHIPNLDDLSYLDVKIKGRDVRRYKKIAAKEGSPMLSDISKITEEMMMKVIVLNLRKANDILTGDNRIPGLDEYENISQSVILSTELGIFLNEDELPVLNTSVFNSIDYNTERFYKKVQQMNNPE